MYGFLESIHYLCQRQNVEHYRIKSDGKVQVIKGIYHIQNVNSYHSRLKRWIKRFNEVASKYLEHYLAWFRFLEIEGFTGSVKNLKTMMVTSCLFQTVETNKSLRTATFAV